MIGTSLFKIGSVLREVDAAGSCEVDMGANVSRISLRSVAKKALLMHKLLRDVFALISTIKLVSVASASLNTEPIVKRVVPMNRTHTYT